MGRTNVAVLARSGRGSLDDDHARWLEEHTNVRFFAGTAPPDAGRLWALLAFGFAALAVDERFALHERIRDRVLAPRDISIPLLSWVAPGDFLIMLVAIAGLFVAPLVWRALDDDRAARTTFFLGVCLAILAVGADSIDPSTWTVRAERYQQTGEEIVELASGLAFLVAVALRTIGLMDRLRPTDDPSPVDAEAHSSAVA